MHKTTGIMCCLGLWFMFTAKHQFSPLIFENGTITHCLQQTCAAVQWSWLLMFCAAPNNGWLNGWMDMRVACHLYSNKQEANLAISSGQICSDSFQFLILIRKYKRKDCWATRCILSRDGGLEDRPRSRGGRPQDLILMASVLVSAAHVSVSRPCRQRRDLWDRDLI